MRATSGWSIAQTEELLARVKKKQTASQIGRMTGRTRNAVIGKCRRMGFTLQGTRWGNKPGRVRKQTITIPRKSCESPPVSLKEAGRDILAPKDKEPVAGIPGPYQCKYPTDGVGVETIYCANRRTDKSYCNQHQIDCYQASWH